MTKQKTEGTDELPYTTVDWHYRPQGWELPAITITDNRDGTYYIQPHKILPDHAINRADLDELIQILLNLKRLYPTNR